jgi:hypothetical protein
MPLVDQELSTIVPYLLVVFWELYLRYEKDSKTVISHPLHISTPYPLERGEEGNGGALDQEQADAVNCRWPQYLRES